MQRIVAGIMTLAQHERALAQTPEIYTLRFLERCAFCRDSVHLLSGPPPRRQLEPSLPFAQSLTFVKDGFAVTQLYELLWFCHHTIEPRRKVRTLDHATYVTVVGAMSDGGSVFIEENDLDRRCRQTEKCAKGVQRPPETKKPTKSLI